MFSLHCKIVSPSLGDVTQVTLRSVYDETVRGIFQSTNYYIMTINVRAGPCGHRDVRHGQLMLMIAFMLISKFIVVIAIRNSPLLIIMITRALSGALLHPIPGSHCPQLWT